VKLRVEEHDAFAKFRDGLRTAILERLKSCGSESAEDIAAEIRKDLIDLELNTIRARSAAAEKLLTKKFAVGLGLGALATTCAVLLHLPPETSLMAGTTAAIAGTAAHKYLEEVSQIRLSDMCFAWKAREISPHAH
jgi:hypothetical protein